MNIDRPLDEIVNEARAQRKLERKKNIRNNRRKRAAKKGASDNNTNANNTTSNAKDAAANPTSKSKMDVDTPLRESPKVVGGIKKKRRSRGGGGANARMDVEVVRKNGKKAQNQPRPSDDRHSSPGGSPAAAKRASKGVKVSVSNLDGGVTQSDISELFETVGPLKSARLIVLPDGRSSGSAEVVFEAMEDALEAIKRYNNVPLDNRPLKITLSTDSAPIRIRGGRRTGGRKMIGDGDGDGARARRSPDHGVFRAERDFDDDMDADDGGRFADSARRSYAPRRGGWRRHGRGYDRRPAAEANDMYQD